MFREHHYDSRNTSLYIMDIESGNYSQISIDPKTCALKYAWGREIFVVNKLAHFSSPKFLAASKIMFHACYDVKYGQICKHWRLFICNENGTGLEEVRNQKLVKQMSPALTLFTKDHWYERPQDNKSRDTFAH